MNPVHLKGTARALVVVLYNGRESLTKKFSIFLVQLVNILPFASFSNIRRFGLLVSFIMKRGPEALVSIINFGRCIL